MPAIKKRAMKKKGWKRHLREIERMKKIQMTKVPPDEFCNLKWPDGSYMIVGTS